MKPLYFCDRIVSRSWLGVIWLVVTTTSASGATPLGTAWTYQGELEQNGSPANDTCDFRFSLWDDPAAGVQVGPTLTFDGGSAISVADGVFTVELDFGAGAFNGDERWLEIAVACPSGGALATLAPRQPIRATPYALQTRGIVVDADGEVGIGTANPLARLHLVGDLRIEQSGSAKHASISVTESPSFPGEFTLSGETLTLATSDGLTTSRRLTLQNDGDMQLDQNTLFIDSSNDRVGFGTANPLDAAHVVGAVRVEDPDSANSARLRVSDSASFPGELLVTGETLTLATSDGLSVSRRFTIQNDGDIQMDFNTIFVDANNNRVGAGRVPSANRLEVEGNASKTAPGDWLANSDRRIKKDVHSVKNALATLDQVNLVSFRYTDEYRAEHEAIEDRRYLNVVAQEFADVFPEYVKQSGERVPGSDEPILQVDPYPLTIYSAAAVQELHGVIKNQQKQIEELRARIAANERRGTGDMWRIGLPFIVVGLVGGAALRLRATKGHIHRQ